MVYLFDTNAVSDMMGAHPLLKIRVDSLAALDKAVICPVVRGEILFGVDRLPTGKKRDFLLSAALSAFRILRCEPMNEDVGDHYSTTKIICRQNGLALNENDFWISACTLALSATLVTRDHDFRRVPGLNVQDWTQ